MIPILYTVIWRLRSTHDDVSILANNNNYNNNNNNTNKLYSHIDRLEV